MFNKKRLEELESYLFFIEDKIDTLARYLGKELVVKYCSECGDPFISVEDAKCCRCDGDEICACDCHEDEWEDVNGICNE